MDDDELIAALAGGDDTALRELFTRHAPWLAARLRKALPSEDVADVLQETFLAAWKGARTYAPRGTPEAWLWVIARNQAALLLRKRGPATLPLDPGVLQTGALQTGTDPAEAALAMADLSAAAAALGPEREVWRLMYVLTSCRSMITGRNGQIRAKSTHDHGSRPECLNVKFRHNRT
jgi:RNA polymerase sigma-70 factor, ECF subfamily